MNKVLNYPGAKWGIAGKLTEYIPEHHSYVEPFFGSGAMLFTKKPSRIETVNDLDGNVVNLFRCIQKDSEKLAAIVMTTPFSREVYDATFSEAESADCFERAARFLVQCWQGHGFRTNGYKVGWKNDVQGRERMYALWNWYRLPEWIIEIAERLRKVQIENRPAIELITRFNHENVFMYLDPPYVLGKRAGKQYKHEMTDDDHKELLEIVCESKANIMISGYDSELYREYLGDWNRVDIPALAEYGGKRTETIWMNYSLGVEQVNIFDIV